MMVVNGIRNPFSYQPWREDRTFQAMFDKLEADIVVMQETKIQRKDLQDDMVLVPGWDVYFSLPKHKKGYSGVAIYTRSSKCSPIRAEEGITGVLCPPNSSTKFRDLPIDQQIGGYPKPGQLHGSIDEATLDSEGRCVILEFPAFVLIGVYSPATRDETRTEFREAFQDAMDVRVRNLVAMGKQVFLCGDLNIIRDGFDTAGLHERLRKEGMTLEDFLSTPSRRFLNQLVHGGSVIGDRDEGREDPVMWDLCREFHPTRVGMYTCWETKKNARPGNYGSRIDYVLCSSGIKDWFIDSNIQEGLLGSDHCPVYAATGDTVKIDGAEVHITDVMNPEGMFRGGERQREWTPKDLLPMSAKLIPEFDRRRSIRDMFFKKPATSTKAAAPSPPNTENGISPKPAESLSSLPSRSPSVAEPAPSASPPLQQQAPTPVPLRSPISSSQQKSAASKRPAEVASTTSNLPQKKTKASLTKQNSSKSNAGLAQSTLRGFFKPKTPFPDTAAASASPKKSSTSLSGKLSTSENPTDSQASSAALQEDGQEEWPASSAADSSQQSPSTNRGFSQDGDGAEDQQERQKAVFDPIESKESWSKLLGKGRTLPKCEHGDDCQILTTKKAGINKGTCVSLCHPAYLALFFHVPSSNPHLPQLCCSRPSRSSLDQPETPIPLPVAWLLFLCSLLHHHQPFPPTATTAWTDRN